MPIAIPTEEHENDSDTHTPTAFRFCLVDFNNPDKGQVRNDKKKNTTEVGLTKGFAAAGRCLISQASGKLLICWSSNVRALSLSTGNFCVSCLK
jgi:hypothetical protein